MAKNIVALQAKAHTNQLVLCNLCNILQSYNLQLYCDDVFSYIASCKTCKLHNQKIIKLKYTPTWAEPIQS